MKLTEPQREVATAHIDYALALSCPYSRRFRHLRDVIESAALEGLCRAAGRFDSTRGATFKTFARKRIIGQVRDGIVEMEPRLRLLKAGSNAEFQCDTWNLLAPEESSTIDAADEFAELLRTLPDHYRFVLSMRYDSGLSVASIASDMGVTEETVNGRIHLALKLVRERVAARSPLTLAGARSLVRNGAKFGDVFPRLDAVAQVEFREWFVRVQLL